jgi:hypothetical protein
MSFALEEFYNNHILNFCESRVKNQNKLRQMEDDFARFELRHMDNNQDFFEVN